MRRFLLSFAFAAFSAGAVSAQDHRHNHAPPGSTCVDTERELGYRGFKHCEYHELYQAAFKGWNCHCYAGQCRPTEFRVAPVSEENPAGLEVYLNGFWFPIPLEAMRKERAHMPPQLLQWQAHGCANDPVLSKDKKTVVKPPHIECVWINTGS